MAACLFLATSCHRRTPDLWVIPDDYEGWVKIDYIVRNAPPLPFQNGYRILQVSPEGYIKTSSELQDGWATDRFQYANGIPLPATAWGEGGRVWGGVSQVETVCVETSQSSSKCHSTGRFLNQCFFIGTERQFRAAAGCAGRNWPSVPDEARTPASGQAHLLNPR